MASTSSNTSPAFNNVCRYDVFLSFQGETRHAFTDHLYTALLNAGLIPFRDNDDIERGEDLQPEIERGIRESRASIVVLSDKYATSRWCLDELCLILEQTHKRNHFVLPIFYHVDPGHVRKQEGSFEINVECNTKWTEDNVERWKAALEKVGNMTGEVPRGSETKFLEKVVGIIEKRLDLKKVYRQANLVGMDTWRKKIGNWLEKSSAQILAVWGMGGNGKTTLARHTVYSNWENFVSISILEDIGSKSTEQLHELQEKLLREIVQGKQRKIPSVWQGTCKIEDALKTEKALIVLDNIVEPNELFVLLGNGIETQCKIIITTRESDPHKWFESTSWRCEELEMKSLDKNDSLELLSRHAFGSKAPMEGYDHLVEKALCYCEGNPLALEVLGSSLSQSNKQLWESRLNSLEKELHARIHGVLIWSYESLPLDSDRDVFLHIACFFVGKDIDYVVKILEPDYSALSGIETLFKSCLLSVSPNKKLMMHRMLQEMARTIVYKESPKDPAKRSRVWRDKESYDMLKKGKGSENIEGLALDINLLNQGKEQHAYKSSDLNTESFKKMDKLKLLQLNCVGLTGPYENFSDHLRWFCWIGFRLRAIPSDLFMENLVAIDMSYSCLEEFEPPADLHSLKILNLRSSKDLREIRNIYRLRYLEILILSDCRSLTHVTLGGLTCLAILNITGCKKLCMREEISPLVSQEESSVHPIKSTHQASFLLPQSLEQLYLMNCNLSDTDYFPLTFKDQSLLIYLNLVNSPFELLPSYNYLKRLRVLDVSGCSDLKELRCLPSTLAELYIYYCNSLNIVTFESHRFTLQEFGYEGCVNLCEVEGLFKLMPVTKLEESDLKHMTWLREYQDLKVCLVGDSELTKGRSSCVQMLYEFNIMSTSLPNIKNSNRMTDNDYTYSSQSTLLSFKVPACPEHRRLEGLIMTFQYTAHGEDWVWFAKISTLSGVNLMYNPRVFGKPDEVGMWSSYWPIGKALQIEETVNVSIIVIKGLDIHWCGASLVYTDEGANESLQENKECVAILGEDFSEFQLSTGAYYLCRRDFFELMEAGKLTPDWFRILVEDKIDYTEVGGWRKTGKPEHPYQSYTEVKTIRCIMYGPEMEGIYKIAELSKSSLVDKTMESTSELSKAIPMDMVINKTMVSTSGSLFDYVKSEESDLSRLSLQTESSCEDTVVAEEKQNNFIPMLRSGEWSDIGHRRYMEDTHICIPDLVRNFNNKLLSEEAVSFYGVFDGHGGVGASNFVRDNLPRIIVDDANFPLDLENVVTRSFMETDAAFARACAIESSLSSGTTALTAMIFGRSLLVANAGDCRAILSRHGLAFEMSKDHRACYDEERLRIESLGGFVEDGYLNGQLSVSRAIGNWHINGLKEMGEHIGPLSAEPELKLVTLTKEDEFLIIGSDGIWDVFRNQDAVDFVRRRLQKHDDVKRCCQEMVNEAMKRGSVDNLTVVIVCFQAEPPPHVVVQRGSVRRSISAEGLLKLKLLLDG